MHGTGAGNYSRFQIAFNMATCCVTKTALLDSNNSQQHTTLIDRNCGFGRGWASGIAGQPWRERVRKNDSLQVRSRFVQHATPHFLIGCRKEHKQTSTATFLSIITHCSSFSCVRCRQGKQVPSSATPHCRRRPCARIHCPSAPQGRSEAVASHRQRQRIFVPARACCSLRPRGWVWKHGARASGGEVAGQHNCGGGRSPF